MSLLQGYYAAVNQENIAKAQLDAANRGMVYAQTAEVADNAAAARNLQGSEAGLNNAKAGQVGADSAANRAQQLANANLLGTQAGVLPAQSTSEVNQRNANTDSTRTDTEIKRQDGIDSPGYAKGTGKVESKKAAIQGKGPKPGPSDTVPAMLTPGEAVLNKGAAEHYGSDVIDHMNKMGLLRMGAQSEHAAIHGLPDPHAKAPDSSDAKKKGAKGKAPTGNAPPVPISNQPAGGAPHPLPGALPGFSHGGFVPHAGFVHLLR